MATIRAGSQAVLLIVDVQVGVMSGTWNAPQVINNIATAVEKARAHNVPVIWVQHADDELVSGSADWQIVPELSPAQDETQIHKQFNSAFEQTELDNLLAQMDTSHIVLAGAATNWCIRATAYGTLERGYDLTLIEDAHTTMTMDLENGVKIDAQTLIRELNIAMTWLTYPGRVNSAVSIDQIDFSKLIRPGN